LLAKKSYQIVKFDELLVPEEYALMQNYPNPFNPSTTIKYQLPKSGIVTLKVYDILGREVTTLVDGFKIEGRYEATFNASSLASGVYLYRLQVNARSTSSGQDYVTVKKMLMIK
jgi:Secretion system C-terminal sorting domain